MSIKFSAALVAGMLGGSSLKTQLDGGFIHVFSGPVPASSDDAVDGSCVLLATLSNGGAGLTFAAPVDGSRAIAKAGAETWAGIIIADGTASFFRHCKAADAGTAAGDTTTPRIQGTCGTSGADMQLTNVALVDNDANTTGVATYEIRLPEA